MTMEEAIYQIKQLAVLSTDKEMPSITEALRMAIEALSKVNAEPIVIRAKTFMRKEDFDNWAADIKKQNKSIVCIPCDAEVVSADEVVRCKDCKYQQFYINDNESFHCNMVGLVNRHLDDGHGEFFCSCGERR